MNKQPSEKFKKVVFFALVSAIGFAIVFVVFFLKLESSEDVEYETLYPIPPALPGITEDDDREVTLGSAKKAIDEEKKHEPSVSSFKKLSPGIKKEVAVQVPKIFFKESPQNLRAEASGGESKDGKLPQIIKWDLLNHVEITEYKVEIANDETFSKVKVFYSKTNSFYTMVYPGKDYIFRVTGVNNKKEEITESSSEHVFIPLPEKEKIEDSSPVKAEE